MEAIHQHCEPSVFRGTTRIVQHEYRILGLYLKRVRLLEAGLWEWTDDSCMLVDSTVNAMDSEGNLFRSSIAGNFASKVTPDGNVSVVTNKGLSNPVGISVDPENQLR